METSRKGLSIQDKETAVNKLRDEFIIALSRDYVKDLSGADMMCAYVRASAHVRLHPSANHEPSPSQSQCSGNCSSRPPES